MTRRPFDSGELDRPAEGLEQVAAELEGYARAGGADAPPDFANRVMSAVASEPAPRGGLLARLAAPFLLDGRRGGMVRMAMVAGTMAVAVLAVVVAGQLAELLRDPQVGPSPAPSVLETPLVSPSPSPSPSATPTPSPTPTPSAQASPSGTSAASADPSDDDAETPEPSDDDNSGPGGGGGDETPEPSDDSSGPGSGGDDDGGGED